MSTNFERLVALLSVERIEENVYRGQSQDPGWGTVYGGQVIAQALMAAAKTVKPERSIHSLHAYFLRPGDVSAPVLYTVDRTRDGSSFSAGHIRAVQHGQPIFDMAASFQIRETGLTHQAVMPDVPAPEEVPTDQERMRSLSDSLPEFLRDQLLAERPIEFRTVAEPSESINEKQPPTRVMWFRAREPLADVPGLHQAMLAYASDYSLLTTALKPHGLNWLNPSLHLASIDHAVWFHTEVKADDWLLHVMHSPSSSGGRGLTMGDIFNRQGQLVASTAQQGLMRKR